MNARALPTSLAKHVHSYKHVNITLAEGTHHLLDGNSIITFGILLYG